MEPRISLITLGVTDLSRSRAFYEGLGLNASPHSNAEITFFQLHFQVLALYPIRSQIRISGMAPVPGPGGITLGYYTRTRDEVETTLAAAVASGGKITAFPEETSWGSWTGHFQDPDGYCWEVSFSTQFLPDADGALIMPA